MNAECERMVEASIKEMINTRTYQEASLVMRCALMNAAKEIG